MQSKHRLNWNQPADSLVDSTIIDFKLHFANAFKKKSLIKMWNFVVPINGSFCAIICYSNGWAGHHFMHESSQNPIDFCDEILYIHTHPFANRSEKCDGMQHTQNTFNTIFDSAHCATKMDFGSSSYFVTGAKRSVVTFFCARNCGFQRKHYFFFVRWLFS